MKYKRNDKCKVQLFRGEIIDAEYRDSLLISGEVSTHEVKASKPIFDGTTFLVAVVGRKPQA